jgi:hypothetical protein
MDESPKGFGCFGIAVAIAVMVMLMALVGDGDKNIVKKADGPTTTQNTRSGTASGNQVEVMSRNQLNLWSDVQNCYGDNSCITVITSTTSTVQNTSTDTRTTVNGDRNVVIGSDGAQLCEDPQTHIFTTAACQ